LIGVLDEDFGLLQKGVKALQNVLKYKQIIDFFKYFKPAMI